MKHLISASVWKLPVIFICENNGFGISVPVWQSTSVEDISIRGTAYNVPGYTADGNDVLEVYEVVTKAIERARNGEGPTLIEFKTYRWLGHWTGDPQVYRTKEEVEEWKKKCPIKRFEEYMVKEEIVTKEELEKIENDVIEEIKYAEKFALESPEPDVSTVMDYVFYEE